MPCVLATQYHLEESSTQRGYDDFIRDRVVISLFSFCFVFFLYCFCFFFITKSVKMVFSRPSSPFLLSLRKQYMGQEPSRPPTPTRTNFRTSQTQHSDQPCKGMQTASAFFFFSGGGGTGLEKKSLVLSPLAVKKGKKQLKNKTKNSTY